MEPEASILAAKSPAVETGVIPSKDNANMSSEVHNNINVDSPMPDRKKRRLITRVPSRNSS